MLTNFLARELAKAHYKILESGEYFGEISGLAGVWASAKTLEACREELKEVLEDWLVLKISQGDKIPGLTFQKVSEDKLCAYA